MPSTSRVARSEPLPKTDNSEIALDEKKAMHKQKKRLAKRAKIGADWDGRSSANDNQNWPLAKALLSEGNTELLKYALAYRRIYDSAKSEVVLGGSGATLDGGMSLDQRVHIRNNGTIAYKGIREVSAAPQEVAPTMRVKPSGDDDSAPQRSSSTVPKPWRGDSAVNDMIDAKTKLSWLQHRLGHLCEPFELACIDGATLQEVGNAAGIANRAGSMGAGRALVHTALITVRDALGEVKRADFTK